MLDGSKSSIISIHALLAESDPFRSSWLAPRSYFYPRSPCGERPHNTKNNCIDCCISIHALLAESDVSCQHLSSDFWNFYPRSPCGERLGYTINFHTKPRFLSTLSLRRATQWRRSVKLFRQFLSTLSLRRATHFDNYNLHCVEISIHALLAESDAL